MDQTILGIIILIIIWILSAVANRKKKPRRTGENHHQQPTQTGRPRFDIKTGQRIRYDTKTGEPIPESSFEYEDGDDDGEKIGEYDLTQDDLIDEYMRKMDESRSEETYVSKTPDFDFEQDEELEGIRSSVDDAEREREALERRIREIRKVAADIESSSAYDLVSPLSPVEFPTIDFSDRSEFVKAVILSEIINRPKTTRMRRRR